MGVQGLWQLLQSTGKPVSLQSLEGMKLAVGILMFRGRAFAHGAMGRRIFQSWGGPTELFLVPASAPRLV